MLSSRLWFLSGASIGVFLLVACLYVLGAFVSFNERLLDNFHTISAPSDQIVIIEIDEASLAEIGRWPWQRSVHSALLDQLELPQVVAFDIIFSEEAEGDVVMSEAIAAHQRVVLPTVLDEQSGLMIPPVATLLEVSETGFVNISPDRDGVVRFTELARSGEESFDTAVAATNAPATKERIIFRGPAASYTTLSYVDVLNGRVPGSLLNNKIVLIGSTAAGMGDLYQTPYGSMAGVEIHASTIDSLLSGTFFTELTLSSVVSLLFLLAIVVLGLFFFIKNTYTLVVSLAVLFVGLVIATGLAFQALLVVPLLYLLLLLLLQAGLLLSLQYYFEQKEKAFIRKGFSQYVAKEVVDELEQNPKLLSLGGEARTLTILFSDIRGFTTLSEQLTPSELMTQLNEYLTAMSDAIMDERGLVDKYIGDAVMAFWGAPLENNDQAADACQSVLAMMKALSELNERWRSEGRPEFAIGVGISTGEVVVGNMGSENRFNYSVIGDEVNFSARIEGLTKQYGVECILGEETYRRVKDDARFVIRELDDVMVKGKTEPKRIYELVTHVSDTTPAVLAEFAKGRAAYINGEFTQAKEAFAAALAIDSADGPSQTFLDRTRELLKNPPTEWNGVFEFKTK